MRLLVVSVGDSERIHRALLEAQPGLDLLAVQPREIDLGAFGCTRTTDDPTLPYRRLAWPVWPRRPYPYSLYRPGLGRVVRRFAPDAALFLGEPSELGVAQTLALVRAVAPKAVTACFSFENVSRNWRGFPRCLRGRAERWALARLDGVAACSNGARQRLIGLGCPAERVRVVYSGANPAGLVRRDTTARRAELVPPDAFVTGYVGRVVPEKGLDLLLCALAALPARHHAVIVGDGPAQTELTELAAQLGVTPRVHWIGQVPRSEVADWLSLFDVLALPSRRAPQWTEQFGMVLAEAMFCGTPVVGSTSGAIPEVIGDAGLVFAEEDGAALASCLSRLSDDAALRSELSARGAARAAREFTVANMARGLLALLRAEPARPARCPPD